MSTKETLIIPDLHGRAFFRDTLSEAVRDNVEVVCLGDYIDPYVEDGITNDEAFSILEELLEVKKARPHMVHLLIGNHDPRCVCLDLTMIMHEGITNSLLKTHCTLIFSSTPI